MEYARGDGSQIDGSFAWRVTELPCGSSELVRTSRPSLSRIIFFVGRPDGKRAREREKGEKKKERERESRREDGEEQRRWSRNVAHARPRPRELLTIHFCDFLLPFPTLTAVSSPALPPPPPTLSSSPCLIPFCSPREFEIADCCWRRVQTREENCSCA